MQGQEKEFEGFTEDKEPEKPRRTGFEYLGPQSEHNDPVAEPPPLPRRNLTTHPMPVQGEKPVEEFGNIDFHFVWPEKDPVNDEWAGKNYEHPESNA